MTVLSLQQSTSVALKTAEGTTTDLATEIENIVKEKMVSACGSHRAWFLPLSLPCMCKVSRLVSYQLNFCMEHLVAHRRTLLYITLFSSQGDFLVFNINLYINCLLWALVLSYVECMVLFRNLFWVFLTIFFLTVSVYQ